MLVLSSMPGTGPRRDQLDRPGSCSGYDSLDHAHPPIEGGGGLAGDVRWRMRVHLDDVLNDIYEVVLQPDHWQTALQAIRSLFGATAAGLRFEDRKAGTFRQVWVGLDPAFEKAYVEHFWSQDPWVEASLGFPVGTSVTSDDLVSRRSLERSAFYNELCKPHDLGDIVGALIENSRGRTMAIGIMRARKPAVFDADDAALLERLIPHLRRSTVIQARIRDTEHRVNRSGTSAVEPTRLSARLGLTAAEARVAAALANGASVRQISERFGTKYNTVRYQLRIVFEKLGVHTQAELVRMVLNL